MVQGRGNAVAVALMVMVAFFATLEVASATAHTVAGTYGWNYPPGSDTNYYNTWSSKQTFVVGDTLGVLQTLPSLFLTVTIILVYSFYHLLISCRSSPLPWCTAMRCVHHSPKHTYTCAIMQLLQHCVFSTAFSSTGF